MLIDKGMMEMLDILFAFIAVYLFFFYFGIFFHLRKKSIQMVTGTVSIILWQLDVTKFVNGLPYEWNIGVSVGLTLFAVLNMYKGKVWLKCFFAIAFDTVWMLAETLTGNLFMICGANIGDIWLLRAFVSKLVFLLLIVALRIVFTNEKIMELPPEHNVLIMLILIGSIYIMNAVFMLAYHTEWEHALIHSLVSVMILLFINILIFYIYIKLAEDLQVRRTNLVYEQQLELCERHQEETEVSMLQMRDIRHSMRNHFISILAYAEKGEYENIIRFVGEIMEEGNLELSGAVNTGNIVIDSLVGYWKRTAENRGIEFRHELNIPMEMPFKGADISLIMGNLLENAVEAAEKTEGKKYIRVKLKYDRNNLLIVTENSYKRELSKKKGEKLKTTKANTTNHGIGLPSVRRAMEKYHGVLQIDDSVSGCFIIRIVLYGDDSTKRGNIT